MFIFMQYNQYSRQLKTYSSPTHDYSSLYSQLQSKLSMQQQSTPKQFSYLDSSLNYIAIQQWQSGHINAMQYGDHTLTEPSPYNLVHVYTIAVVAMGVAMQLQVPGMHTGQSLCLYLSACICILSMSGFFAFPSVIQSLSHQLAIATCTTDMGSTCIYVYFYVLQLLGCLQ